MTAPLPPDEAERLLALRQYAILDTPPEVGFDRITRLAARLFQAPISLVSFIDEERQWLKSCYGVEAQEIEREFSFCAHAILSNGVFIVPDTRLDERFAHNPQVTGGPHIRFYAGAPLKSPQGHNLGTLCLVDTRDRPFSEEDSALLTDLAAMVVDEMELRRVAQQLHKEVSERRQTEVSIKQARAEAEAASYAKSEFLSRMSHELRTPMNAILGFAQLLEMDAETQEQQESVGHILKAGRHLLKLINEVLDIARIESDRLSLSLEPVNVHEVTHEVCGILRGLASQQQLQLEIHLQGREEQHVLADCQRLKQVLVNLVANAIKYNYAGGTVSVTCEDIAAREAATGWGPEPARLRLNVTDTGPGLSQEQQEKLFLPFERVGFSQSEVEGTGLGLALSKRLVQAMGGRIGVQSTPGQGSTFWIEFAVAEPPHAQLDAADENAQEAPSMLPQQTEAIVLYVEDNLSNLSLVQRVLRRRPGIRLLPAIQGRRGLELAREHQPHLILLDLHLPDINGDEVLRLLQSDSKTSDIPVIVISADATGSQIDRVLRAGARDYLTKPLDVIQFLHIIDGNLRHLMQTD